MHLRTLTTEENEENRLKVPKVDRCDDLLTVCRPIELPTSSSQVLFNRSDMFLSM